ncbi:MAG: glycosyltransferase family 4 protein [Fimbriiglobus sp.]
MRITILGGPFLSMPPAPCGAVERVWHGLAEEFAARGHAVTVVCRDWPGCEPTGLTNGVRYLRVGGFRSGRRTAGNLVKDFGYAGRAVLALPAADILVTNSFWAPVLAGFRRSAGKVAVHVQRMPKGQLFLYDRAARLQAVSTAIRDEIARQRPRLAAKTRQFPNPIDTRVFVPPPGGRSAAGRTGLYTGRVHPEKGLPLLIDAAALLAPEFPGLRLRVVGPWEVDMGGGGPEFVTELRTRAAGAAVEFVDPVYDRPALADVYRAADFYCYPSVAARGEASPVAPVEAMATGLAPVVSDLPQFRDFITDGRTGRVFDHTGPAAAGNLADVLRGLLSDPAAAAAMGAEAVRVAAGLGYARVAGLYLDDFEEMLAQ